MEMDQIEDNSHTVYIDYVSMCNVYMKMLLS